MRSTSIIVGLAILLGFVLFVVFYNIFSRQAEQQPAPRTTESSR
jgi:TRAP-type C4-dicarboxylate transport system permease small subunit